MTAPGAMVSIYRKLFHSTIVSACVALSLGGCTMIANMMPSHREAERKVAQQRVLQISVMRYADEYAGRIGEAASIYQSTATTPEDRLLMHNWRYSQSEAVITIASGVDSLTNALDCVVFATLSRMVIEDVWVEAATPQRVDPLLTAHRDLENKAWALVHDSLTDDQTAQLKQIIAAWRAEHPKVQAVGYVHFTEFAKSIGLPRPGDKQSAGNLFSLLGIDPFSSLDPAVQELNQTRELAERTIYYLQRAPRVLSLQVERLTYQLAVMPETKSLLADVDRISLAGSAADRLVTTLPDVVAREREALVTQLTAELERTSGSMQALSSEVRATLIAGTETAKELQAAIAAADSLTARFNSRETKAGPQRPFDVREYTELVSELSTAAQDVSGLLQRSEAVARLVGNATQGATDAVRDLQDRLFLQLLTLIVVAIVGSLLAALAYRAVTMRLGRHHVDLT